MTASIETKARGARVHRWVRVAFVNWAIVSTSWLANTMRTRGVSDDVTEHVPH